MYLSYAPVVYILSKYVWIMVCIHLGQEFEHGVIHCSWTALFFQIGRRLGSIPGEVGDLGNIQRMFALIHYFTKGELEGERNSIWDWKDMETDFMYWPSQHRQRVDAITYLIVHAQSSTFSTEDWTSLFVLMPVSFSFWSSLISLTFAPPWMLAERMKKLSLIHSIMALVSGALPVQKSLLTSFSSMWMLSS